MKREISVPLASLTGTSNYYNKITKFISQQQALYPQDTLSFKFTGVTLPVGKTVHNDFIAYNDGYSIKVNDITDFTGTCSETQFETGIQILLSL